MAFQITGVKTRYFDFENPDTGEILHLEPPKLKTVNQFTKLDDHSTIEDLATVVSRMISKNKEGYQVDAETIMEWMTADQISAFASAFIGWVNGTRANDPN